MLKASIFGSRLSTYCLYSRKCVSRNSLAVSSFCTSAKTISEPKLESEAAAGKAPEDEKFKTIYRNSRVKMVSFVNRFNPSFTKSCAIIMTPLAGFCYWSQFIDESGLLGIGLLASSFIMPLQVFSFGTQRLVGFVYLHKEKEEVKISYVTYFGKRRDFIVPVESVMSFGDSPRSPFDILYRKIRTFDSNRTFKLDMRAGEVLDEEAFKHVFGDHKL